MVAMVQVVVVCFAWVLTALSIPATTSENERHKQIPLGFRRDFWYVYMVNGQICLFFCVYVSIICEQTDGGCNLQLHFLQLFSFSSTQTPPPYSSQALNRLSNL
ncbi:hypothetical protein HanHA300_Chr11g0401031 [Helianthus annuus]|nr:hypothetical protein HanHA300_Chr11g0401031 [Helianthus annuus]KAJ0517370.1 hypothetical protein HanHA89_Chr11g0424591 [Helianthus annuus]KAJ0685377.1 hypothetical protein HanLR1_Chr11g0402001 [Helianthus annuus]